MTRTKFIAATTLPALLAFAIPAQAGEAERVRKAIADASGKIEISSKVATGGEAAEIEGRARAALDQAQAEFRKGRKEQAVADANNAGQLADLAVSAANRQREQADARERDRAASAQAAAASAQESAAAAEAAAARPAVVVAEPVPAPAPATTTTVTTVDKTVSATPVHHTTPRRRPVHHVTHTTATPAATTEQTTTTVTTTGQ